MALFEQGIGLLVKTMSEVTKFQCKCPQCPYIEAAWAQEIAELRMEWHIKREHKDKPKPLAIVKASDVLPLTYEDMQFMKACGISLS